MSQTDTQNTDQDRHRVLPTSVVLWHLLSWKVWRPLYRDSDHTMLSSPASAGRPHQPRLRSVHETRPVLWTSTSPTQRWKWASFYYDVHGEFLPI